MNLYRNLTLLLVTMLLIFSKPPRLTFTYPPKSSCQSLLGVGISNPYNLISINSNMSTTATCSSNDSAYLFQKYKDADIYKKGKEIREMREKGGRREGEKVGP